MNSMSSNNTQEQEKVDNFTSSSSSSSSPTKLPSSKSWTDLHSSYNYSPYSVSHPSNAPPCDVSSLLSDFSSSAPHYPEARTSLHQNSDLVADYFHGRQNTISVESSNNSAPFTNTLLSPSCFKTHFNYETNSSPVSEISPCFQIESFQPENSALLHPLSKFSFFPSANNRNASGGIKNHLMRQKHRESTSKYLANQHKNISSIVRKNTKSLSSFPKFCQNSKADYGATKQKSIKPIKFNSFCDLYRIPSSASDYSSSIHSLPDAQKKLYLQHIRRGSSASNTNQDESSEEEEEQGDNGHMGWQSLHKKILRRFNEKSSVMTYMDKISAHQGNHDYILPKKNKKSKKLIKTEKKETVVDSVKYVKITTNEKCSVLNNSMTQDSITAALVLLGLVELRSRWQIRFPDLTEKECLTVKAKDKTLIDEEGVSREPVFDPYLQPLLSKAKHSLSFDEGVFHVHYHFDAFINRSKEDLNLICMIHPTVSEFLSALKHIMTAVQMPVCKTFCYERLKYLEQIYPIHLMFNSPSELQEIKGTVHRDFYNVRKVDTHVHHSACMQQKHLLRFIRKKYRTEKHTVVATETKVDGNVKELKLEDIFRKELGMSAYDASVDTLDVHALGCCFQRFDLFNLKYNPFGHKRLRDVFLKTDNYIKGRFLAELTREVMDDLEESKYENVEWRVSIYGKSYDEWSKLSDWIVNNKLHSPRVRWLIQVPRMYYIYRKIGIINNFGEMLRNIFKPIFDAVLNPKNNKNIFCFLQQIVGWDSVDDESYVSKYTMEGGDLPSPDYWISSDNPPYSYYAYYMYVNILTLNQLLFERGLKTLAFRPHCGEAGSISHLASMYILSTSINHGIMLKKTPVLMYLYYLTQIGLAVSPLSNNALFLDIAKSPLYTFFKIGLNVSLSTDDPLMFHFTNQPLLEEYSIAAHTWKLSPVDLSELARNSILQSGYEVAYKRHWLGENYKLRGSRGNNILKTNLPNIRLQFREDSLKNEYDNLYELASLRNIYRNPNEEDEEEEEEEEEEEVEKLEEEEKSEEFSQNGEINDGVAVKNTVYTNDKKNKTEKKINKIDDSSIVLSSIVPPLGIRGRSLSECIDSEFTSSLYDNSNYYNNLLTENARFSTMNNNGQNKSSNNTDLNENYFCSFPRPSSLHSLSNSTALGEGIRNYGIFSNVSSSYRHRHDNYFTPFL